MAPLKTEGRLQDVGSHAMRAAALSSNLRLVLRTSAFKHYTSDAGGRSIGICRNSLQQPERSVLNR